MAAGLSLNMWSVVISAIISGILQDSFPVTGMINGYILITNESLCPVGGKISSNLICKGFFFPTTTSYPIFHCSHYEDIARSNDFFLGGDQWRYWRLRLRKCLRHWMNSTDFAAIIDGYGCAAVVVDVDQCWAVSGSSSLMPCHHLCNRSFLSARWYQNMYGKELRINYNQ